MIGQAVDVNTLRVLASTRQVRSKREAVKTWAKLDTLGKFAEDNW